MLNRTSKVKFLKVQFIGTGKTLQIGDTQEFFAREKVLAVQRYLPNYFGNEGSFKQEDFQLFREPVPGFCRKPGYTPHFIMKTRSSVSGRLKCKVYLLLQLPISARPAASTPKRESSTFETCLRSIHNR